MALTCVACQVEFRTIKTGWGLQTMTTDGPYQLFAADLLQCPGCQTMIARPAHNPITEHYKPDYQETVRNYTTRAMLIGNSWANPAEKAQYEIKRIRKESSDET